MALPIENGFIILEGTFRNGHRIKKENFYSLFNNALTYDELIRHDNSDEVWKSVFDDWKQKGILN